MSNSPDVSSQERRYDEASLWIARLDKKLTAEQSAELQRWMAADPDNEKVLLEMARLWDRMDSLGRLSDMFPAPARATRRGPAFLFGAAATVLLGLMALWFSGILSQAQPSVATQVYQTAIGEHSRITLPDGSVMVLNTDTVITVEYTPYHRLLTLVRGELYVDVASDELRPLSVIAGDHIVQAVGTQFNVRIDSKQKIELMVLEGKVKVGVHQVVSPALAESPALLAGPSQSLGAGEALLLGASVEEVTEISPADIEVKLSWRQGNLIFLGESLEDAVREIERYTSVEFVFLDQDLKKVRVAGLFKAGDVEGLLATLRENFDIVYQYSDDKKVLLGKK